MKRFLLPAAIIAFCILSLPANSAENQTKKRKTTVNIEGEKFMINGEPTYKGRKWQGYKIEGLLMNSRMVQGILMI